MAWPGAGTGAFGQPASFSGFGSAAAAPPAGGGGFAAFATQAGAPSPFGQAAQQSTSFPFGGAATPQPSPGGFGFEQPPAASPQPAAGFGFSQAQPPASGFGFPQAAQAQTQVPASGFGFPHAAQAQAQPPASGFGFPQPQPAAQQPPAAGSQFGTFGQQAPAGGGSQAPTGSFPFGAQAQAAPPASGFTFGQQHAPAQQAAPAAAPGFGSAAALPTGGAGTGVKFAFGSAQRKKTPGQAPAAFAEAAAAEDEREEMDGAALEAAKAAVLASLPKFQGGGGGGRGKGSAAAAPPLPPPRAPRRNGGPAGGAMDAEEVARRAQRASRFGAPPAAPAGRSESPAPQPVAFAAAGGAPFGREGSATPDDVADGGEGDADAEGGVRAGAIVGTCEEMCPAAERERRARLSDIQIFERPDLNNSALTSADLAVKRFARTIDDSNNAPEFFRTRGALRRTMQHLRDLLDRQDARLGLVHKFLWDRYRSVRQDLYIQGMDDEFSVNIYEEVVRFHLLSEHELCEEEASITEMEGFNSHLNMEQMNKALISLNDMYNKLAAAGRPAQHEAEFRAYHLLSLMGQHGKFKGDQQAFLSMLQAMRPDVRGSAPIQWVLKLQRAFAMNNFVRFFGLVRQAPYLLACLGHIYFGQARGRALRTLADTLAPKADVPAALELSWLVDALMLDSVEEAQQLCAMHGFEAGMQSGVPVVLLLKGAYIDPPPPVPRKRSAFITGMAPATRSLAVTTPAIPPMSPEEAARMEKQRQEQLRQYREQAAQRAQLEAEQRRQQEQAAAVAAAAAAKQRQEAEAARLAQEELQREQQLARQRQAQLEAAQQHQAALLRQQEEERRRQEEQRHRQQQLAEWQRQQEEQQRAAAEAERRRREAEEGERRQRQEAEAAEQRRLAELERQRLEELRRLEEERRARREAKRRRAIQQMYLARWRTEARRRIEQRERLQRLATNLKACRVGLSTKAAAARDAQSDGTARAVRAEEAPRAAVPAREAVDLPALAAPLLLRRSPSARTLYWKLLLTPPRAVQQGCPPGGEQQQLRHLHAWLALHLQRGRAVEAASGSAYVEGPLPVHASESGDSGAALADLTTCLASPDGGTSCCSTSALAGASGIVAAVPGGGAGLEQLRVWLSQPSGEAVPIPTLLVAATDAAAQHWQQEIAGGGLAQVGPAHVVSVEASAGSNGSGAAHSSSAAAYSTQRLMQGLRWLAANAPPQPILKIAPAETFVRDALAATSAPLRRSPAAAAGGPPAAHLLSASLRQAITLVQQLAQLCHRSAIAAWQWPPPELAPALLRSWHDGSTAAALVAVLRQLRPDAATLMLMAEGGSAQALMVAAHVQLAALEAAGLPPLVVPPDVEHWFEQQLEAAKAAAPPAVPAAQLQGPHQQQQTQPKASLQHHSQQQQQWAGGASLGQKRKAGASPPGAAARQAVASTAAAQRSWAAVVAGTAAPAPDPASPMAVAAPVTQTSAHARVPLLQQLREQVAAEQRQEVGLREHAVLAAAGATTPLFHGGAANGGSFAAAAGLDSGLTPIKVPQLLQAFQQAASEERAANKRLVELALS